MGLSSLGVLLKICKFYRFAPTFLEVADVKASNSGMQPIQGESLTKLFYNEQDNDTKTGARDYVLIGKERHDVGRPDDVGYPIRGIRQGDYLFIRNFETDRWPSGNPETGYLNCDGGATKSQILADRREQGTSPEWDYCFGKRPVKELYNVKLDPDCIDNLINEPDMREIAQSMEDKMVQELSAQNDPRMFGNGGVFDTYQYSYEQDRDFYNRFKRGEEVKAGWVYESDFESAQDMETIKH